MVGCSFHGRRLLLKVTPFCRCSLMNISEPLLRSRHGSVEVGVRSSNHDIFGKQTGKEVTDRMGYLVDVNHEK